MEGVWSAIGIPARINIITLGVSDLQASAGFYAALGWTRSAASSEEIVWFKTAGSILGLFPYHSLAADAHLPASPRPAFGGVTLAINLPTADAVQPALEEAETAGGTIIKPASKADWGGVSGYFADPDGHAWEIAWNPFLPLAEDGTLQMP